MCGSPAYVAPEVLMQKEDVESGYDLNCDFWSVAVIMFYLLSGEKPFDCEDNFELFEMIKKGDFHLKDKVWETISDEAKDLIMKVLVVDPSKRITADELATHAWV